MNILFCIPKLEIGGAEVFIVRLVLRLSSMGHNCFMLETNENADEQSVLKSHLRGKATVLRIGPKILYRIADKLDRETKLSRFKNLLTGYYIRKYLKKYKIQIVNTHVFAADSRVINSLKSSPVPIVITMHGCYERKDISLERTLPVLKKANGLIYVADKNLQLAKDNKLALNNNLVKKIYNGYAQEIKESEKISRSSVKCEDDSFIFILVARGAREKGWEIALNAFTKLNRTYQNIKLLLVGDSEYLQQLKSQNVNKNVLFLGSTLTPQIYMQIADAGLLPTYYESESLPNSVTEYLFNRLPVIATDVGDIRNMIKYQDAFAGILLEKATEDQLFDAMKVYLEDAETYEKHKELTSNAAEKFNLDYCAASYIELFNTVLETQQSVIL
jgi:glycosyltransferase involved in cell wall biosynthesis